MAKRDTSVAKWHQKQFERSEYDKIRREEKEKHKVIRQVVYDKVWFDSLSFDEKNDVVIHWVFHYKNFSGDNHWYTSHSELIVKDGESKEDYCKRIIPGCLHKQRDMKLSKLLS